MITADLPRIVLSKEKINEDALGTLWSRFATFQLYTSTRQDMRFSGWWLHGIFSCVVRQQVIMFIGVDEK